MRSVGHRGLDRLVRREQAAVEVRLYVQHLCQQLIGDPIGLVLLWRVCDYRGPGVRNVSRREAKREVRQAVGAGRQACNLTVNGAAGFPAGKLGMKGNEEGHLPESFCENGSANLGDIKCETQRAPVSAISRCG